MALVKKSSEIFMVQSADGGYYVFSSSDRHRVAGCLREAKHIAAGLVHEMRPANGKVLFEGAHALEVVVMLEPDDDLVAVATEEN